MDVRTGRHLLFLSLAVDSMVSIPAPCESCIRPSVRTQFAILSLRSCAPPALAVLFHPNLPRRPQCSCEQVFVRCSETHVRGSASAPATCDRNENLRRFGDELLLYFWSQHQVAVALFLGSESRENSTADAKIGSAHVRSFLNSIEAECDSAEVGGVHLWFIRAVPRRCRCLSHPRLSADCTSSPVEAPSGWHLCGLRSGLTAADRRPPTPALSDFA